MIIRSSSFEQKDKCCLHRLYMSHQQSVLDFQYYTSHLLSVAECGPNALSVVYFVVSVSFFYSFTLFVYVPCFHTPQAHSVSVTAEISCQFRNRCSFIMKTGGRVIKDDLADSCRMLRFAIDSELASSITAPLQHTSLKGNATEITLVLFFSFFHLFSSPLLHHSN